MNRTEFWTMNNPLRRLSLRFEVRKLFRLAGGYKGGVILEIGCGEGQGAKNILRYFTPKSLISIDLDPKMIKRARKRLKDNRVVFRVQDASDLSEFADESINVVVDMAIIHHIPNWQECIHEIYRVLKPNGLFLLQDASIESFTTTWFGKMLHRLLDHPYGQMYTKSELESKLMLAGFKNKSTHYFKPYLMWKVEQK